MDSTVIIAILVGIASFISGAVALSIFCRKNIKWCRAIVSNTDFESQTSRKDLVSARLPSLIFIEIIFLLWYLMGAIPLMLFCWFYSDGTQYDIAGSIVFVSSFIPLFTTHIIRIWLLNLRYNVTSLSMLNQLGMMKWRDIDSNLWSKIYYKYKWTHTIKSLVIISCVFDAVITVLYIILLSINLNTRVFLNGFIFSTLTLVLIAGVIGLKSFKDPFNIFREEMIILMVWFIALTLYAILYWVLWPVVHKVITDGAWTIMSTFFGASASLLSIIIHFHFNDKSIETVMNNPPQLSVIVSTKEGLEIFLKFLVTELSVENLEFFTLSMRWRHRLALRHERKEKKMRKIQEILRKCTDSKGVAKAETDEANDNEVKEDITSNAGFTRHLTSFPEDVKQITNNIIKATSERLLVRPTTKQASTHLKQLPFPILTFEFLDKDAHTSQREDRLSLTDVSRVPEFSKTQRTLLDGGPTLHTPVISPISPQLSPMIQGKHGTHLGLTSPALSATSSPSPAGSSRVAKGFRETAISVFFDQYDFMNETRRRNTVHAHKNNTTLGLPAKVSDTPEIRPMSFRDYESGCITPLNNDISPLHHTPDPYATIDRRPKISLQITHPESHEEDGGDLAYSPVPTAWNKLVGYEVDSPKTGNRQKIMAESDNEDEEDQIQNDAFQRVLSVSEEKVKDNEPIAKDDYNFYDDKNEYDEEWTGEFMSSKRVDYDRFCTLSEDINISSRARKRLKKFFKKYPTVKLFCNVAIAEYDTAFEMAWKNVWQNLNDSLRRFHQSKFFQQWLQSNAAMQYNGLNVTQMQDEN
eukprot:252536_1